MKKKLLFTMTVFILAVVSVFSASAAKNDRPHKESEQIKIIDHVVYFLYTESDGDKYYSVVDWFDTNKAAKTVSEINIKDRIDGITVKEINFTFFDDREADGIDGISERNKSVKKITLPNTITYISDAAFSILDGVEELVIPKSVKTMYAACKGMESLKKVTVNADVKILYGFKDCKKLESIILKAEKLERINFNAFENCTSLKTIKIPKTVKLIYDNAFENCTSLKKVVFEDSEREKLEIGFCAFKGCTALKKVYLPKSVKQIIIGGFAFKGCTKLTNVYYRGIITQIGTGAFFKCKSLKSFVISKNVTKIGGDAFNGCSKLKKVTFENTKKAPEIGKKAFSKVAKGVDFMTANKKVAKSIRTNLKSSGMKNPNVYYVTYAKLK